MSILHENDTRPLFDTIYIGDKKYTDLGYVELEHINPNYLDFYWKTPYYQYEFSYDSINERKYVEGDCDDILFDEENRTLYLIKDVRYV